MTDYERDLANPPYRWLQIAIVWFGCIAAAAFFSVVSGAIVYSWIAIVAMLWERS